jgi:hypothetical protein
MHSPLNLVPGPIGAGAASRNRGDRCRAFWLLLPALAGACAGPPEPQAGGNETVVAADDGVWERLPVGARVRLDGVLSGEFDNGARVDLGPNLCASLAMTRSEWDALMVTAGAGRRVTAYGSKAASPGGSTCRLRLDRVGFVAR